MPIILASTGTARPRGRTALAASVARILGGDNEPPMLAAAEEYLNDAIIQFNTRLYEFNKIGPVSVTLTGGVGTLPTAFYKELECQLVDSTGVRLRQLNYIDYAEYQHTFNLSQGTLTAPATYYTLFNTYRTGQVTLLPAPSATSTDYVKITYYQRINLLSAENDVLDAPQEIERALVLMAQSDILRVFKSAEPGAWQAQRAIAEQAWLRFAAIDMRHPDMKPRFRLAPLTLSRFPQGDVLYIKVN